MHVSSVGKMGEFTNTQVLDKWGDLSDKSKHPVKWANLPTPKCW